MVAGWVLPSISLCNIIRATLFVLQLNAFIFTKHFSQSNSPEVAAIFELQFTQIRYSSQLRFCVHNPFDHCNPLTITLHFSYIINIIDVYNGTFLRHWKAILPLEVFDVHICNMILLWTANFFSESTIWIIPVPSPTTRSSFVNPCQLSLICTCSGIPTRIAFTCTVTDCITVKSSSYLMRTSVNALGSTRLRSYSNLNFLGKETTLDLLAATISSPLWKPPFFTWQSVSSTDVADSCNHDPSCRWNKTIHIAFFPSVNFPAKCFFFCFFFSCIWLVIVQWQLHGLSHTPVEQILLWLAFFGLALFGSHSEIRLHAALKTTTSVLLDSFFIPFSYHQQENNWWIFTPDLFVNPVATWFINRKVNTRPEQADLLPDLIVESKPILYRIWTTKTYSLEHKTFCNLILWSQSDPLTVILHKTRTSWSSTGPDRKEQSDPMLDFNNQLMLYFPWSRHKTCRNLIQTGPLKVILSMPRQSSSSNTK